MLLVDISTVGCAVCGAVPIVRCADSGGFDCVMAVKTLAGLRFGKGGRGGAQRSSVHRGYEAQQSSKINGDTQHKTLTKLEYFALSIFPSFIVLFRDGTLGQRTTFPLTLSPLDASPFGSETNLPLASPRRASLTASETGAAESDGSSAASSPMPQDAFDDGVAIGSCGVRPSGDRASSPTFRRYGGPRVTPSPGVGWYSGGRKTEHSRPSPSPTARGFWAAKISAKPHAGEGRSTAERVAGGGKSHAGVGFPLGAGPPASPTFSTPPTGPPIQLWTTLAESAERPFVVGDPFPSPAGPSGTAGTGTTPPPVLASTGSLRGVGGAAGASSQGRPRPATERPRLTSNLRPLDPGYAGTRGSSRQTQLRDPGAVPAAAAATAAAAAAAAAGGTARESSGDGAPTVPAPLIIDKASGRGRKVAAGRKGGSGGIAATSSPRAVPMVEADVSGASGGQGRGQGQGRTSLGAVGWPSSSLETPGALTTLKAEKVMPSLGRRRVHKPHSGGDSGGKSLEHGVMLIG